MTDPTGFLAAFRDKLREAAEPLSDPNTSIPSRELANIAGLVHGRQVILQVYLDDPRWENSANLDILAEQVVALLLREPIPPGHVYPGDFDLRIHEDNILKRCGRLYIYTYTYAPLSVEELRCKPLS